MKSICKAILRGVFMVLAFPAALFAAFGRIAPLYSIGAHLSSLVPGLPGDYFRAAYYRLTLMGFGAESRIQFGSYFVHPQARVGNRVYIGTNTILGRTDIGDGCQLASGVQILSGRRQHQRQEDGSIGSSKAEAFETVKVGSGCWIGAGAIVMATIGDNTTVGAGSVVTKPIPPNCVAVGSPARVIRGSGEAQEPGH